MTTMTARNTFDAPMIFACLLEQPATHSFIDERETHMRKYGIIWNRMLSTDTWLMIKSANGPTNGHLISTSCARRSPSIHPFNGASDASWHSFNCCAHTLFDGYSLHHLWCNCIRAHHSHCDGFVECVFVHSIDCIAHDIVMDPPASLAR